jgi:hypothetical protein
MTTEKRLFDLIRRDRAMCCVPENWCDPILTGDKAVIGKPPYTCRDIEKVLIAVRNEIRRIPKARVRK